MSVQLTSPSKAHFIAEVQSSSKLSKYKNNWKENAAAILKRVKIRLLDFYIILTLIC